MSAGIGTIFLVAAVNVSGDEGIGIPLMTSGQQTAQPNDGGVIVVLKDLDDPDSPTDAEIWWTDELPGQDSGDREEPQWVEGPARGRGERQRGLAPPVNGVLEGPQPPPLDATFPVIPRSRVHLLPFRLHRFLRC